MADEEPAPEGGEALELAPETEDETPEPIAKLAADLGWTPKDEWQGEPEKWKPAEQFIRDGRDIQQTTARELRSMREQVERLSGVTTQIVTDKVAERDAYWQQKFNEAVEAGDTEAAAKLASSRPQPAQNGPDPQVTAWVAKNAWYNADPLAQARAVEISDRLKHLPVSEQLTHVERAMRKEFPEHFPKAKDPPGVQTAATRSTGPTNRQKGFADMPADSQRLALEYEKNFNVKKDVFARSYWADKEGVSR